MIIEHDIKVDINYKLSDEQRQQVEGVLARWAGRLDFLSEGHPYKHKAPPIGPLNSD